jgi:hypothetical protein
MRQFGWILTNHSRALFGFDRQCEGGVREELVFLRHHFSTLDLAYTALIEYFHLSEDQ